jgi:hypothetical protein
MPLRFSPLPDDEPPIDLPAFLHRLKTEPAFAAKMRGHYEAALALPLSPETEELHASARKALATLMDEAVDELLDVLEPERTRFLTRILEMRAVLQEVAGER